MHEFDRLYAQLTKEIKSEIHSEKDLYIANTDINELVNYFCVHRILTPIEIDPSRTESAQFVEGVDTRPDKDLQKLKALIEKKTVLEIETLTIEIPIKASPSNSKVCRIFATIDSEASIKLEEDIISIKIITKEQSSKKTPEEIEEEKNQKKNIVLGWLKIQQQHLAGLNQHLLTDIKHYIGQRKERINATQKRHEEIIHTIKIPLKQKEDTLLTKIRLDNTPLVQRVRPKIDAKEEYVLDRQKVLDIIHVMDNQGRQFEKTPYSYQKLGEDDLRNILLVNLNSIFEGKAAGEAFSNKGKTDIMLTIDKGNILIIECKIWKGSKKHHDAVTQLISYLTWRQNYGIIINFCRNKDMSKMIQTVSKEINTHPTFITNGKENHETHFSTIHQSPGDSQKQIEVHHIFYNLYAPGLHPDSLEIK
jgi:hypothetical protein